MGSRPLCIEKMRFFFFCTNQVLGLLFLVFLECCVGIPIKMRFRKWGCNKESDCLSVSLFPLLSFWYANILMRSHWESEKCIVTLTVSILSYWPSLSHSVPRHICVTLFCIFEKISPLVYERSFALEIRMIWHNLKRYILSCVDMR